ncbi:MAG: hypothetical protein FWE14_05410 [Lachnospiraceae bacterium]|nr:hypothetical protein [Lachnospiraceae bacterium]
MKKQMTIIFIILTIIFLTSCGSNEVNRITGDVANINQGNNSTDTGAEEQDIPAGIESLSQPDYKGYTFTHSGTIIAIDSDFAPILKALGEPRAYFEAESCAFEGLDKIYTYFGFEIDTYPQGDRDFVSAIVLKDDTVATNEGLRIGSSRAEMEAAYGTPRINDNGQLIYDKDGMRLCFIIDGETVISIEYQTTVLDL